MKFHSLQLGFFLQNTNQLYLLIWATLFWANTSEKMKVYQNAWIPHYKPSVIPQGCADIWGTGQADSSVTDSQHAQHNKTQNISWERHCSGFMMTMFQARLDQGAVLQGIPSTNSTLKFHICIPHHTNFWNYSKETCNVKPLSCT